jgi:hypothetical protein
MSLLGWPSSRMGTAMNDGPMTAPLVERVARTICGHTGCLYPQQMCRTDCRGPQQAVLLEHQDIARAAIAEVFHWLAEPSEDVIASGIEQIEKCTCDWTASAACAPGHTWQTMLRQMRKEALGEEP